MSVSRGMMAAVALAAMALAGTWVMADMHETPKLPTLPENAMKCKTSDEGKPCEMTHKRHEMMAAQKARLAKALEQIDAAGKALAEGDSAAATEALAKAREAVAAASEQMGKCSCGKCKTADSGHVCPKCKAAGGQCSKCKAAAAKASPVNTQCPIMGGKIDPEKVPANLTREFNGKKVGFCCAGCLPKWDALGDEEKTAKLEAAK